MILFIKNLIKKLLLIEKKLKKKFYKILKKKNQRELLLSEIVFNVKNKIDFKDKYEKILLDIRKN